MARQIQIVADLLGIQLPGGWILNGGDVVVVSDDEWDQIDTDEYLSARVIDQGTTTAAVMVVPTWRDLQWAAYHYLHP